jgi:geranylgeranyl pyrophosphate synthase
MLAHAYDNALPAQRTILDRVGTAPLTSDDIASIQTVVTEIGSRNFMEKKIVELRDEAINSLRASELAGNAHEQLVALAHAVTHRSV